MGACLKANMDGASLGQRAVFGRTVIAVALAASLLASGQRLASAADGPAGAAGSEQRKAQAASKYEQGVAAYLGEHYADAVRFFLEADAIEPSAALSFNIARAYERLDDDAATLRWYRNYVRLAPQGPKASEVQESINRLSAALAKKGIQQITVQSTPAGATVAIDERALGVTPLTVELRPGSHHVLLTLRSFSDLAQDFSLEASTPLDLSLDLKAAPSPPPLVAAPGGAPAPVATPRAPPKDAGRHFGVVPWITLGAGAAALAGAAVFEVRRRSAEGAAQQDTTQLAAQDDLDARDSRQTTARIFLGLGGVLVVTGALLVVLEPKATPQSRAVISPVPGGASLALEHRF
jgi:hypothetical protein